MSGAGDGEVFESQHLASKHLLEDFDSGVDQLDHWLRSEAIKAADADLSRTYVWTRPGVPTVVGYFVLIPTIIAPDTVPRRARGPYSTTPVTGYLIAKLALAQSLHGRGLGRDLLIDACSRAAAASHEAGGRLIVVDAIDEAAHGFYRRYGFKPIEDSDRLYMRVVDFTKTYADALYGAERVDVTRFGEGYEYWASADSDRAM